MNECLSDHASSAESHTMIQMYSEFERVSKAVIPLHSHGRDGGSAYFWIPLDQLQKSPYAFDPAFPILWVRYLAISNDVVDDLDARRSAVQRMTSVDWQNAYDYTSLAYQTFSVLEIDRVLLLIGVDEY